MQATLEPFIAEHGVEILGERARAILTWLLRCQYEGPGFTARLEDGRILACAGFVIEMPYSANGWVMPTNLVRDYPRLFHKLVLTQWKRLRDEYGWRRVQGVIDPTFPERIRWMEHLGFVREGIQRRGGDQGQDLWYYGWLRENGHG